MASPINAGEVLNLVNLSINGDNVKFGTCSMESDKFITVCENVGGKGQVAILDLQNGNKLTRQSISAESAIMNPVSKVLALKSGQQLQVYNLELQVKMKSYAMPSPVSFWKWISPNTIALITAQSVFHWSIDGNSEPVKMFDRNPQLGDNTQIINYRVSGDDKWCLLCGISAGASAGVINGTMQLFNVDKSVSQMLQGHSGAFSTIKVPGRTELAHVLCFEDKKPDQPAKLQIMEVRLDKNVPAFKVSPQTIPMAPDAPNDFPVTMNCSSKHGLVYLITKMGYVYVFDIFSGKAVHRARITQDTVFASTENTASGGVLAVTRRGQLLHVCLNPPAVVPYVIGKLQDSDLAVALASRLNLPGADDIYRQQFQTKISGGDIQGAAKIACDSPNAFLRTPDTINLFKSMPAQPGTPAPIFQYFSILLENGAVLNAQETLELAKPIIDSGRVAMLEKYIAEGKLDMCEALGDMVVASNLDMALSIYLKAEASEKVVSCFMRKGEFDKIVTYATKVGFRVDYSMMLQQLVRSNPAGAVEFAKKLVNNESGQQLIDATTVTDVFVGMNLLREATAFLLDALKANRKEEGFLQTRLLEINLRGGMPQVADAILGNEMFTHYDKHAIAQLCEQAGLNQRALENFQDIADIKRVMQSGVGLTPEFLLTYFGSVSKEGSIEILREMLSRNMRQNLASVVAIAQKYSDMIGAENLIALFQDFKSFEGLYHFLGHIVNNSQLAVVHLKYIDAAARMQQFKEVERVCRDSTVYDPLEVKALLMEMKLPDPRPLIYVCDRFDFVDEMTAYLYSNNMHKYIEVYVQKVSPQKTPQVIGKLLDLECSEEVVKNLINSSGQMCPVGELVEQVERRNRLRLLHSWLEARIQQGNQEPATHNAIGKIYITLNREPVNFLSNNQFYEASVLGAFCEKLDPHLAFIAYKQAKGACDDELIKVTMENGLYKDLARYLVERQDMDLWTRVLKPEGFVEGDPEPPSRRYLLDQVVQTALPETKNPDEVLVTVKAFLQCDLPGELIELLERLVLQGSDFSDNQNLQNLLIYTAIRANKEKVMEYINRLDNFDGPAIAKMAASEEHGLYEEALTVYIKFGKASTGDEQNQHHISAMEVIVDMIKDMDRAKEFAERVNINLVWSKLGQAQLNNSNVAESIAAYIKASNADDYHLVIAAADREDKHDDLVTYLKMCRKSIKETVLDTQLIYSLARINRLSELEEVISVPNVAKIDQTGERCFDEGMYDAAKILFTNINNNAKLALCFVKLKLYREAVDAATKANSVSTWKEVNLSCLGSDEFRLANICGLHIIVHPDHLEELIGHYERAGRSTELIQLMEQGLGLDNAHSGVFTELGVLYTKYLPEKLMEHLKIFHGRMNINKILRACERALMWGETVYLYKQDNQHDAAIKTMVDHPSSFAHDLFLDCVQKVRNPEVQYKAITFYLSSHPLQLGRLLQVLTPNLDHARVVHLLRKNKGLELSMEYMKNVQKENLSVVNEALNEIYVTEEDYEALRQSIAEFDNFDQILLAQKLEKHELLEFRRISAHIFKMNKRYAQSMTLSKGDNMFKDAIDTAAESGDQDLVEELLRFFVSTDDKAGFSACLFSCYDLVRPDVAIELAWRNQYMDHAFPYFIQYVKHLHEKIEVMETRTAPPPEPEADDENAAAAGLVMGGLIMGSDQLMIGNGGNQPGYGYPPQQGGGIPDPYQQQQGFQQQGFQQQQQGFQQQQQQGFQQQGFPGQGF